MEAALAKRRARIAAQRKREAVYSVSAAIDDLDGRRARRARCRARTLQEAAAEALGGKLAAEQLAPPCDGNVTVRELNALELGLAYVWMARDEAENTCGSAVTATRWWTGAAPGIQQRWEEATGLCDVALEANTDLIDDEEVARLLSAEDLVEEVEQLVSRAVQVEGPASRQSGTLMRNVTRGAERRYMLPSSKPRKATAVVVGAFVEGRLSPCGFAATKQEEPWVIDVLGVNLGWQRRGIGRLLALHFVDGARRAGHTCFRVDAVPTAVGFWAQLGFAPLELEGCECAETRKLLEQRERDGDRDQLMELLL